jgi:hypothetical protein
MQAALRAKRPNAPDLGQHLRQKGLAAKPRIDGHHQNHVAEMKDIFDHLRRARRRQYHACFLAERANLGEHPMQVDRGPGLALNEDMIGPGIGEDGKVTFRLDDHQVHVERLCRRPAYSLQHDRPDRDVGHEPAVHHIHMNPVGTGLIDGADLLPQTREIRGQHGRRDDDWRHFQLSTARDACGA